MTGRLEVRLLRRAPSMRPECTAALSVLFALAGACGDDLLPAAEVPAGPVTVMSYNLAQIDGGEPARRAADAIAATRPDFLAVQECASCEAWLPPELAAGFAVVPSRAGVALAHDSSRWSVVDEGVLSLGDGDDGWGERVAQWSLFSTWEGQAVYVYATHWCVTIRRLDDSCTVDRQLEYAESLLDHIRGRSLPGIPVLLAGDFNVFDGFEDGEVISFLEEAGLADLFRLASPEADGTTFVGNGWAPSGRLDYLFSTAPVDVVAAGIEPVQGASDHYPVAATVQYPLRR